MDICESECVCVCVCGWFVYSGRRAENHAQNDHVCCCFPIPAARCQPAALRTELQQPDHLQLYVEEHPPKHANRLSADLPSGPVPRLRRLETASGLRHGDQRCQRDVDLSRTVLADVDVAKYRSQLRDGNVGNVTRSDAANGRRRSVCLSPGAGHVTAEGSVARLLTNRRGTGSRRRLSNTTLVNDIPNQIQ